MGQSLSALKATAIDHASTSLHVSGVKLIAFEVQQPVQSSSSVISLTAKNDRSLDTVTITIPAGTTFERDGYRLHTTTAFAEKVPPHCEVTSDVQARRDQCPNNNRQRGCVCNPQQAKRLGLPGGPLKLTTRDLKKVSVQVEMAFAVAKPDCVGSLSRSRRAARRSIRAMRHNTVDAGVTLTAQQSGSMRAVLTVSNTRSSAVEIKIPRSTAFNFSLVTTFHLAEDFVVTIEPNDTRPYQVAIFQRSICWQDFDHSRHLWMMDKEKENKVQIYTVPDLFHFNGREQLCICHGHDSPVVAMQGLSAAFATSALASAVLATAFTAAAQRDMFGVQRNPTMVGGWASAQIMGSLGTTLTTTGSLGTTLTTAGTLPAPGRVTTTSQSNELTLHEAGQQGSITSRTLTENYWQNIDGSNKYWKPRKKCGQGTHQSWKKALEEDHGIQFCKRGLTKACHFLNDSHVPGKDLSVMALHIGSTSVTNTSAPYIGKPKVFLLPGCAQCNSKIFDDDPGSLLVDQLKHGRTFKIVEQTTYHKCCSPDDMCSNCGS